VDSLFIFDVFVLNILDYAKDDTRSKMTAYQVMNKK